MAAMLRDHSAVMVVGPRATGKTTSAETIAATAIHLADARRRSAFVGDIEHALTSSSEPILVDEWQEVPAVLGHMKVLLDADPRRGRFIVTGSVRGDVDNQLWPATGRLVRLEMFGLTERELAAVPTAPTWLATVLTGVVERRRSTERLDGYVRRALRSGFPEAALESSPDAQARWLGSYVDQLVTRDAAGVDGGRDPLRLRRYLTAYALNSAGVVDDSTLYTSAGISKNTARAYDRLLQNLLVTEDIPAWTTNRLKRLVLAPKRFLVDPGLFVGVLGVDDAEVLADGDLLGRVLETFVVAQVRAELALMPRRPRLHHLRTEQGRHEVDLVIEVGARRLVAIEVKATSTPGPDDARHLRWLRRELGDAVIAAIVLHTGPTTVMFDDGVVACPISSLWT